jgi:hypothetical protein
MKKRDIAINLALPALVIAFLLNMAEEGYLKFVDLRPIAETELAKVLDGNKDDCITIPTQTTPVPMSQALKLEGKTVRQVLKEFPTYFCEGRSGAIKYFKFLTDSTIPLYVTFEKSLDEPITYAFNEPKAAPTSKTETGGPARSRSIQLPRKTGTDGKAMEKR